MEITYVNQKEIYLTYEHRIEIPVEFTYVIQKRITGSSCIPIPRSTWGEILGEIGVNFG